MKFCKQCNENKDFSAYYKDKQNLDGLKMICKVCYNLNNSVRSKKIRQEDPQKAKANDKRKRSARREKRLVEWDEWYSKPENRKTVLIRQKERNTTPEGRGQMRYFSSKYKIRVKTQIPLYVSDNTEELNKIKNIYITAVKLTINTGKEYQVDHFYPLKGLDVSGLHCALNLRIITKEENMRKGNRIVL